MEDLEDRYYLSAKRWFWIPFYGLCVTARYAACSRSDRSGLLYSLLAMGISSVALAIPMILAVCYEFGGR